MANPEHLEILEQGVEAWNEWRDKNGSVSPDLSGANLIEANLRGAHLQSADLIEARFIEADLVGTVLCKANLSNADLSDADLSGANLDTAILIQANLYGTTFAETNLSEANLAGATLGFTVIADVDLSEVDGLKEIWHRAPSTVGIDTIYKSKGNIPEDFLRGCGVPEEIIVIARTLRSTRTNYYSCFISHSAKDKRFCE